MLPKEILTKRIDLLLEVDRLSAIKPISVEEEANIDKQLKEIGNQLLALINERQGGDVSSLIAIEIPKKVKFEITLEEYVEFVSQGFSDTEISVKKRISTSTLSRWKFKNKIKRSDILKSKIS